MSEAYRAPDTHGMGHLAKTIAPSFWSGSFCIQKGAHVAPACQERIRIANVDYLEKCFLDNVGEIDDSVAP